MTVCETGCLNQTYSGTYDDNGETVDYDVMRGHMQDDWEKV